MRPLVQRRHIARSNDRLLHHTGQLVELKDQHVLVIAILCFAKIDHVISIRRGVDPPVDGNLVAYLKTARVTDRYVTRTIKPKRIRDLARRVGSVSDPSAVIPADD